MKLHLSDEKTHVDPFAQIGILLGLDKTKTIVLAPALEGLAEFQNKKV
jgi:hypothetical protein